MEQFSNFSDDNKNLKLPIEEYKYPQNIFSKYGDFVVNNYKKFEKGDFNSRPNIIKEPMVSDGIIFELRDGGLAELVDLKNGLMKLICINNLDENIKITEEIIDSESGIVIFY